MTPSEIASSAFALGTAAGLALPHVWAKVDEWADRLQMHLRWRRTRRNGRRGPPGPTQQDPKGREEGEA